MKKITIIIFVSLIAVFAGYNIYFSYNNSGKLSNLMLANVEALANDENKEGYQSMLITDLGSSTQCVDNILYSVARYNITCLGKGSLECASGVYATLTPIGNCYTV